MRNSRQTIKEKESLNRQQKALSNIDQSHPDSLWPSETFDAKQHVIIFCQNSRLPTRLLLYPRQIGRRHLSIIKGVSLFSSLREFGRFGYNKTPTKRRTLLQHYPSLPLDPALSWPAPSGLLDIHTIRGTVITEAPGNGTPHARI